MKNTIKKLYSVIIIFTLIITSIIYFFTFKKNQSIISIPVSTNNESIEKTAYLTFDDGPSSNTEKILSILKTYNIKATFFVVGPQYKFKNDLLKKIVDEGHEIAIHSYEHNYNYIYSSKDNYLKDFYLCLEWIKKVTGISPTLYRFPGGSSNTIASKQLIKSIIKELEERGFIHADWNVDTLDSYVKNDPTKILKNSMTSLKRNENNNHYNQTILMHDDTNKPASVNALPSLIEKLTSMGYNFKPLTQHSNIIKHVK